MKEKKLLERKVTLFDTLFPLIVTFGIMLFIFVFSNVKFYVYITLLVLSILIIYFNRFNAVDIILFEDSIIINYYLMKKTIKIKYQDIIDICIYSSTYEGTILKITLYNNKEKYTIHTKFYDKEFTDLLINKTKLKITR